MQARILVPWSAVLLVIGELIRYVEPEALQVTAFTIPFVIFVLLVSTVLIWSGYDGV